MDRHLSRGLLSPRGLTSTVSGSSHLKGATPTLGARSISSCFASQMAPSTPTARLGQVSGHLAASEQPLATRFRPKLPPGLHPSFTPLNPVTFLLKAATIRPHHVALTHPEKGLSYTYYQW